MADPFRIWLAIAIVIGICIRGVLVLRGRYLRRHDDAEKPTFEKDVEWQLQQELSEAASQVSTPENEMREENRPLLPPFSHSHSPPPRVVAFTDDHLTAGSWHGFKAYSKAELPRVESFHHEQQRGPTTTVYGTSLAEQPLYVNPKQFHRILKRRMTRQLIEEYFRSRLNGVEDEVEPRISRGRKRRGEDGRFLTAEQMERMAREAVVVA